MSFDRRIMADAGVGLRRPFHGGGKREIVSRPKCYAFDTGFVCFEKGWDSIRSDDRGRLWEYLVLDALRTQFADSDIFYWQDKSRREIDFVLRRSHKQVDVIECKIDPDKLDINPVVSFRSIYPEGENYIISPVVKKPYRIRRSDLVFTVCTPTDIRPRETLGVHDCIIYQKNEKTTLFGLHS